MEDNASEKAGKSTMSVVVTVWAMRTMGTRTSVAMRSHTHTRAVLSMSPGATLSGASLDLRELISDNRSPFADRSCAFFVRISGRRDSCWHRYDLGISNHELSAWCFEDLEDEDGDSVDKFIGYFEDFDFNGKEIELLVVGVCGGACDGERVA